jgi:hypothetical protein
MKSRFLIGCTALFVLYAVSNLAQAIGREDVLECGLPDGSKFVLRSKYDYSLIPLPAIHSSRVTNRGSWAAEYVDPLGHKSRPGASVHFSGIGNTNQIRGVCAYFGMIHGVPIAAFTHMKKNGDWFSLADFPWSKLRVDVGYEPDTLSAALRPVMEKAGIKGSISGFGHTISEGGQLMFEHLLSRTNRGYLYDRKVDAVYQSFSTDNGKTWSDPIVTTDAKIFEIGKSWLEQSFIARPISLNGKPIKAE